MAEATHPVEATVGSTHSAFQSRYLALAVFCAAMLMIYVIGLDSSQKVHDAFHDVRHAFGFPCH